MAGVAVEVAHLVSVPTPLVASRRTPAAGADGVRAGQFGQPLRGLRPGRRDGPRHDSVATTPQRAGYR